jgi:putative flippase GtrA
VSSLGRPTAVPILPAGGQPLARVRALFFTGEFGRFLMAGGVAASVNFFSRFAWQSALGFEAAVLAAYLTGFVVAFVLNRWFVFPASGKPIREEMAWFFGFNAAAFLIVWAVSGWLLANAFGHWLPTAPAQALSHGFGIAVPVCINFVAHKFVTFARRTAPAASDG